jgi:cyclophilin family peptidyl-prolyl cis-trans isomerase
VTTRSHVRCWSVAVVLSFFLASLGGALPAAAQDAAAKGGKPVVTLTTSLGVIELELDAEKAPVTVDNFLAYVDAGHFDGTIFHRVIPGFMIQGGGFTGDMTQKPTKAPIKNEAANGLANARGTVAMARTNVVDSATAQFFINLKDNDFLNHSGPGPRYGYAVFGRVTKGMDVVDKIAAVPTGTKAGHQDVPNANVVIESAKRK